MPASGLIIHNRDSTALDEVLAMGCWTECLGFALENNEADFKVGGNNQLIDRQEDKHYQIELQQTGIFNTMNATAAALAARHAGVPLQASIEALQLFAGVKRRQEVIAEIDGVRIIDDFAHHPTAIDLTLKALKANTTGRLFAVIELRSNTMKMGVHASRFANSLAAADVVLLCEDKKLQWDLHAMAQSASILVLVKPNLDQVIEYLAQNSQNGDQIVIMSNGGFDNMHHRLIRAMQSRH
jgi:UDP-N-acetylmuramate: L-alanyl-gamma-D-glutamyl-meso-diaminopimelate ligase